MGRKERYRKRALRGLNYLGRGMALAELGFLSYEEYLASDLWAAVKSRVFARKGRRCKICQAEAYTVHHNRYDRRDLAGERFTYLEPICRPCHFRIEFSPSGKKRPLITAKANFTRLRNRSRKT